MNSVALVGRLTRDPELRTTQVGVAACTFTVAVDRRYTTKDGKREADFIVCVAWRQTAEFVHKYFTKGQRIGLTGSLQTRQYQAQDGSNRTVCEVVVDNVEFVEKKQDSGHAATHGQEDFVEVDDEQGLPF